MRGKAKEQDRKVAKSEEKWTKPLMDAGFTLLPSVVLERQQALGLDAVDVCILLHIIRHWWDPDRLPFPSKKLIAECMGITESTVRKRIKALEVGGLITRHRRVGKSGAQVSNSYSLEGLIKAATPYALEAIEAKEQHRAEGRKRRIRRAPKLHIVKALEEGDEP